MLLKQHNKNLFQIQQPIRDCKNIMGNSICLNMVPETHISSHFDIKNIQPKQDRQNIQTDHTNQSYQKRMDHQIQKNDFHITSYQIYYEKENPQSHRKLNYPNLQSNQRTDFSRSTSTNLQNFTQKQLTPKNNQKLHLENNTLQTQSNLNFKSNSVPFSVVFSVLNKKIIHKIHQTDPKFFKKYYNDTSSFQLLQNKFYGHIYSEKYGIFINQNYFYQGQFEKNENEQFLPLKGTYISQKGKYVGEFKAGKPHGKGKYYQYDQFFNQKDENDDKFIQTLRLQNILLSNNYHSSSKITGQKIYEGEWKDGQLFSGNINTSEFRYEGSLKNGKPEGYGKLQLKKSNITYKGTFKEGMFNGQFCTYETPNFVYQGEFRCGKKQGLGVLTKKVFVTKSNNQKIKYFGQQRYEGLWKKDLLVIQQYVTEKKR